MSVEIVGLIALGLQVFGEVNEYVEGVRCARKELTAVTEQLQSYRVTLDAINSLFTSNKLGDIETQKHVVQSVSLVEQRMHSIRDEVRKLAATSSDTAGTKESQHGSNPLKMTRKQKLMFPFRRDKIKDLVTQLEQVNSCLGTSLHLFQIEFLVRRAMNQDSALAGIESQLKSTLTEVLEMSQVLNRQTNNYLSIETTQSNSLIQPWPSSLTLPANWKDPYVPAVAPDQTTSLELLASCDCAVQQRTRRLSRTVGWLSVLTETTITNSHEPGCVWSDLPSQTNKTTTIVWQTGGFWRYLPTAITATYDRSVSILPVVRAFNLVDLDQTRAMRMVDLVDDLDDMEWDDPAVEHEARRYWHSRLMCLYRDRKASPKDVDYRSNRTILHHMRLPSWHKMSPYMRLTWDTFEKLNFSKDMMLCDGLSPWEYNFAKSRPLESNKLNPQLLPWGVGKWLEPDEIAEPLLTASLRKNVDEKCTRAFVIAMIMHERRSLLEIKFTQNYNVWRKSNLVTGSNVGLLCQAIIMRLSKRALQLLDDGASSWREPFLGDETGVCAMDLAIMWFPELINSLLRGSSSSGSGPKHQSLPRPHPSCNSFLEIAVNIGLRYGGQFGKATTQDYLVMIKSALEQDHPVYFHRVAEWLGESQDCVTWHLADRRRRLLEFAVRRLPRARGEQRTLFECQFVDEKVEEVLHALSQAERSIPEALQPRNIQESEPLKASVFEYAWHSEELCGRLESLGFDPEGFIRSRCHDGPFPMVPLMSPLNWDTWKFNWLMGLVSKSATGVGLLPIRAQDESSPRPSRSEPRDDLGLLDAEQPSAVACTFLHTMMAYVGYCIPGRVYLGDGAFGFEPPDPKISAVTRSHILSETTDGCICGCSSSGCSPLAAFLKGVISPINVEFARTKFALFSESVLHSVRVLTIVLGDAKPPKDLVLELLRLYTFECLDCRHTCCVKSMKQYVWGRVQCWPPDQYDEEDREEIYQEDLEKLQKLEDLLKDFEKRLGGADNSIVEFVQDHWLPVIKCMMEEESARRLSEIEMQKIQEVGVKLDIVNLGHGERCDMDDDHDTESITESISLHHLQTDEERLMAIKRIIDRICE